MGPEKIEAQAKELDELRQENATLTETVDQLEVCVVQLLKEVKFLRHIVTQAGNKAAS